jgi:hypothetical protein
VITLIAKGPRPVPCGHPGYALAYVNPVAFPKAYDKVDPKTSDVVRCERCEALLEITHDTFARLPVEKGR